MQNTSHILCFFGGRKGGRDKMDKDKLLDLLEKREYKELKEELGITAEEKDLIVCGDRNVVWDCVFQGKPFHDRQISRVFIMRCDLEEDQFHIDPVEVDSVRWMDFEKCIHGVEQNTFLNCISLEELQMVRKKLSEKEKLW